MGIGSSKGAFYKDEFAQSVGKNENAIEAGTGNPKLYLDDTLHPYEGEGFRADRFREDEPGVLEWIYREEKNAGFNKENNDVQMEKKPEDVLGINPTHDNNILTQDILYKTPGGLVHKVNDLADDPSNALNFNTDIGPWRGQQMIDYEAWAFKNSLSTGRLIDRDRHDYDIQGYWKDNPDSDLSSEKHLPDTYKKPNHITFSNESKYHGNDIPGGGGKFEGGEWGQDSEGRDTFTPGRTNLQYHDPQEMIDYFKNSEPDAVLILPGT